MTDYIYKTKPHDHQRTVFEASRGLPSFGLLMEMGTGKTKVVIDTACYLHERNLIRALLVVAPNGVHWNWSLREIPAHLPDRCARHVVTWSAAKSTTKRFGEGMRRLFDGRPELKILCMNVEAFSTPRGRSTAEGFLQAFDRKVMFVVDESSKIKTVSAKRTKAIVKMRSLAAYRRILTGTPVTQSPLDIYSQCFFLGEEHLGFTSYYVFKQRYAQIVKRVAVDGTGRQYQFEEIVGYRHLDELTRKLQRCTFRVTKKECLDLPDKIYTQVFVDMTKEQCDLYKTLKRDLVLGDVSVPMMLTRLLRFQQITGGFVPIEEFQPAIAVPGRNPKIDALMSDVEDLPVDESVIIWARFRAEIKAITKALREVYGPTSAGSYFGDTSSDDRRDLIDRFQGKTTRFFVGNPQAAGMGLTLTAASTVYYFSNDFSLENRLQSEDRCHRIGQRSAVVYKDILCRGTIDERVVGALADKKSMADLVVGDVTADQLVGEDF